MKVKAKILALAALAFAGLAPTEARAGDYKASLTVTRSTGSTGKGTVYASTSETKGASETATSGSNTRGNCKTSALTACPSA